MLAQIFNSLLVPCVLGKRYRDARKEIPKLKNANHRLEDSHVRNVVVLPDRAELFKRIDSNGCGAEVGVASGEFSDVILRVNNPMKLHLIDLWADGKLAHGASPGDLIMRSSGKSRGPWSNINSKFKTHILSNQVELHRGYSWDMLSSFEDEYFDWLYLDAGHDFDSVKKDLAVAHKKIKSGGIIAGHDYVRWGKHGYRCGVVEAVNEFCKDNDFEFIYITLESHTNGSFAIRQR